MMASTTTRGLRLNNPLNIRINANNKWQGTAAQARDAEFVTFVSMTYGVRAAAVLLINYQDRYDLRTVRQIVSKWAPPEDHNDTGGYINAVANRMDVSADDVLDMHKYEDISRLIQAMVRQEQLPSYQIPQGELDEGLKLAGVVQAEKPLAKSPSSLGKLVGIATAAAATVDQGVQQVSSTVSQVRDTVSTSAQAVGSLGWDIGAMLLHLILTIVLIGALATIVYFGWRWWKEHKTKVAAAASSEAGEVGEIDSTSEISSTSDANTALLAELKAKIAAIESKVTATKAVA